MIVTTFTSRTDTTRKREIAMTLDELADLVRTTTGAAKDVLPRLKAARFGATLNERGSLRWGGNVTTLSGVAADYDDEEMTVDEAIERLEKAGIIGMVYTSPSNRPDAPRWRVVCPFSGLLPPGAQDLDRTLTA